MTILESLKSLNGYPIPENTFQEIALKRGLSLESEVTQTDVLSNEYNLGKADVYSWLSNAPDVTQESISYSFTDSQRKQFKNLASEIYEDLKDSVEKSEKPTFGYRGSRF